MKSYLQSLLLTLFITTVSQPFSDNLLTVLMMVKDEEASIVKTLQPFIDGGITSFVILDTGSTDQTIKKARELFKAYQLKNSYIIEQPFIDFSTSRNYLIEQAEKLLPNSQFFAMVDAEWYINNVQGLLQFLENNVNAAEKSFYICLQTNYEEVKSGNESFYLTRVFKAHENIRFKYPVHEDIFVFPKKYIPQDIFYTYQPTKQSHDRSIARNTQDVKMLLAEYEKNPNDYRVLYFLGQTYVNLHDFEHAYIFYEKAIAATSDHEIQGRIHYKLAQMHETEKNWDKALHHYLASYNCDPDKAESLIRVASHYCLKSEYALCFLFALQACNIPHPENNHTEKHLYDYIRHNLLSTAAWHVKEYEIGKQATIKALEHTPNATHLQHNLKVYEAKTKQQ